MAKAPKQAVEISIGAEAAPAEAGKRPRIENIVKKFAQSKDYRMRAGFGSAMPREFRHLSTGILELDLAMNGGWMPGVVHDVWGKKHSGKTTTKFKAIAAAQKRWPDKHVLNIDMEDSDDPIWAKANGVDWDTMLHAVPDFGEDAVDLVSEALKAGDLSMIVLDSVAMLEMKSVVERDASKPGFAGRPRLLSNLCQKVLAGLKDLRKDPGAFIPIIVVINQVRVGTAAGMTFHYEPGGENWQHMIQFGVRLTNDEQDASATEYPGLKVTRQNEHSFKVTKDKTGASLSEGSWVMWRDPTHPVFKPGQIIQEAQMWTWAVRYGLAGGGDGKYWMEGCDDKLGNKDAGAVWLVQHPAEAAVMYRKIICAHRKAMGYDPENWEA